MIRTRSNGQKIPDEDPLESMRKERDEAIRRVGELQEVLRDETSARKDAERALDDCRESEERLHKKIDGLRAANQGLEESGKKAWGQHRDTVDRLAKVEASLSAELDLKAKQSDELKTLQEAWVSLKKARDEKTRELGHLQTTHQDMQSLLDTRTRELRDAQAYLTKTDSISHADVQRMVEKLNSLIFQLSAQIADDFAFGDARPCGNILESAYGSVTKFAGQPMAHLLYTTSHVEDCAWVQLGLQAALSCFTSWLITTWDPRFDAVKNKLLTDIHGELFKTEPQAISARWRGLVRRSVKRLGDGHDATRHFTDQTMNVLGHILCISGARTAAYSATSGDRYRDKVQDLVLQSLEVQRAIGEEVSSSDFQVICPHFDDEFYADSMENVDDCGRGKSRMSDNGRLVLCCTELGLRRCENVAGRDEGEGEIVSTTLVKAKVALRDDGGKGRGV